MTLAFSTSSPTVSVALIGIDGVLLESAAQPAPGIASNVLPVLVEKVLGGREISVIQRLAVDVGPGGFTSLRVGVTFAKSLAWALKIPVVKATSFDLVSVEQAVAIPYKKGHWLLREPGLDPNVVTEVRAGVVGYGQGFEIETLPSAERFAGMHLSELDPVNVVPSYYVEPSISEPKNPHVLPRSG